MKGEGRLDIVIARGDGSPRVAVTSSRPLGLTRTLCGMTCREALATIPLLFSVCGMAQGAAAAEAIGAAERRDATTSKRTARRLLVLAEAAREHLIAAVRDWARLTMIEVQDAPLLRIMQDFQRLRAAIDPNRNALHLDGEYKFTGAKAIEAGIADLETTIETFALAESCERFLSRHSESDFVAWTRAGTLPAQRLAAQLAAPDWRDAGSANVRPLPAACALTLLPRLLGPAGRAFVAAPAWNGVPCETTALTRQASQPLVRALAQQHGNGLLTRLAARLVELAALPGAMRGVLADAQWPRPWTYDAMRAEPGVGLAELDNVRGRLVHAVRVRDNRIEDYAILAPTEWNFHPEGVAAQGVTAMLATGERVEPQARAFLHMIDPCVAFDLRAA